MLSTSITSAPQTAKEFVTHRFLFLDLLTYVCTHPVFTLPSIFHTDTNRQQWTAKANRTRRMHPDLFPSLIKHRHSSTRPVIHIHHPSRAMPTLRHHRRTTPMPTCFHRGAALDIITHRPPMCTVSIGCLQFDIDSFTTFDHSTFFDLGTLDEIDLVTPPLLHCAERSCVIIRVRGEFD